MPSSLLVNTQNKVTTFTLNRPEKCNALDGELIQKLQEAFFAASRDDQTRMIVLKGAGKHFCAGADIDWMQKLAQSSFEQSRDDAVNLASLLSQMYLFAKPIVALAQGSVLGGGLGLLACSDIVIAAQDASFCFSEVKIGLVPAVVSPYIISILGEHLARYYFLTGERFSASEAHRIGLIHHLVMPEELIVKSQQMVQVLLSNSPAALLEIKRLVPKVANQEISLELSEKTAEIFAKVRVSAEAREGLNAFLEKRVPSWS